MKLKNENNNMSNLKPLNYWSDIDYMIDGVLKNAAITVVSTDGSSYTGLTLTEILDKPDFIGIDKSDVKMRFDGLLKWNLIKKISGKDKTAKYDYN